MAIEESANNSSRSHDARWGQRGTAAATIAAALTFEQVTCRFGEKSAVKNFSLAIAPGEIVCLLGPSGCGKTTLLRLAAGIEQPTSGRLLLNGQEVSGPERFVQPEKRSVGLMFQDFALFPHLTIVENVAFGLKALDKQEARKEAYAALERVGLAGYGEHYPHVLSGGEQQRVALARAIVPRPSVLLMDEPFSGLDARLRDNMREETLVLLKEMRATCIIVTHHAEEAMRMGDRIAIMRCGELVQAGSAKDLYATPLNIYTARMFSDINEISCRAKGGEVETPLGKFGHNGLADGAATLCVRQRALRIVAPGEGRVGRVLRSKFLGDAALLEIAVEGLEATLLARVREEDAPEIGAEIGVEVDSGRVLIFNQTTDKELASPLERGSDGFKATL